MVIDPRLIEKYNQPVPRYTSYPTVPFWKDSIDIKAWENIFLQQFKKHNSQGGISLYIHLPFCESLCTYCGCNKRITNNHNVELEYLAALETEWKLYRALMNEAPVISELHLGGGTPTFFSPENLEKLMAILFQDAVIPENREFSFEGHPNNTTKEHLETLYRLGFRRVSFGVQDNDPEVQRIINRIQPVEKLKEVTDMARRIGYTSVNYDLIYGLPKQTLASMERTVKQVLELKPDRIAFYSYAHVPWTSKGQRLFDENDLPPAETKLALYQLALKLFTEDGYTDIGMDHFALPQDDLYKAAQQGAMHRNFMGYTTQHTSVLVGLGVSSISDVGNAFAQNSKILHDYYAAMAKGILPVQKGYFLTDEDVAFRKYILDLSCKGYTSFNPAHLPLLQEYTFPELKKLEADHLITWNEEGVKITTLGHHFIRNICRAFDLLQTRTAGASQLFSKAI
jgi:oxygen-independent coproporphyrinogen III oxidase